MIRLLLLVSDPALRRQLADLLEQAGQTVTAPENVAPICETPDLDGHGIVIFDAGLPDLDIARLCRQLKTHQRSQPCVLLALTRQREPEYLASLLSAGADDYLLDWDDPQRLKLRLTVAQRRLHESGGAALFQAVFQGAALGIALTDLRGSIVECNATLSGMLGYQPQELIGKRVQDLTHRDELPHDRQLLSDLIAGRRQSLSVDKRYVHRDGHIVWGRFSATVLCDGDDRPQFVIGLVENITAWRQADEALRESEARFRVLFTNMPELVLVVDEQSIIQYVNRGVGPLLSGELIGQQGFGFLLPESQQRARAALQQALSTRKTQTLEVLDVFGLWWVAHVAPVPGDGTPQRAMIICTEFTERKKTEDALRKEQQLLRRILELQERDRQLIAYEIHDGFAQQLTAALMRLEAYRTMSDLHGADATRLLGQVIDMLAEAMAEARRLISGLRPPILDESGIVVALEYLVCERQGAGGPKMEFVHDVRFERLAPPLESAIFRIVQESLANACRHSRSPRVRVELIQRDERVRVRVRDWGVGFDAGKVGDSHFGLQGIRQRARLLGGWASIRSVPGKGTSVLVELPLVERT